MQIIFDNNDIKNLGEKGVGVLGKLLLLMANSEEAPEITEVHHECGCKTVQRRAVPEPAGGDVATVPVEDVASVKPEDIVAVEPAEAVAETTEDKPKKKSQAKKKAEKKPAPAKEEPVFKEPEPEPEPEEDEEEISLDDEPAEKPKRTRKELMEAVKNFCNAKEGNSAKIKGEIKGLGVKAMHDVTDEQLELILDKVGA